MNGPRIELTRFVDDGYPEADDYANNYVFLRNEKQTKETDALAKLLKRCTSWALRAICGRDDDTTAPPAAA